MPEKKQKKTIPLDLVAPCGMNCRLCWGYIREKNSCPGCRSMNGSENRKTKHCMTCKILNCEQISKGKIKYCSEKCDKYPCYRLRQLDKRYRTRYEMSMIDNLNMISESGIRHFIRSEKEKWACPECGDMICVHRLACLSCGHEWR